MDKRLKTALIIGGIILSLVFLVPTIVGAVTGWQGYGYGMMGSGMMGGFGFMGLMGVLWMVGIGLVIWAISAVARGSGSSSGPVSGFSGSALEILKKRYASGEINKAEYEEKKKT